MIYLFLALYSEGKTDDRFLPTLIQRTAQRIVDDTRGEPVEVMPIYLVNPHLKTEGADGDEEMLEAARIASEQDILIVHKDADTQTHKGVLNTRFTPGQKLIKQAADKGESVCKHQVPIVPIKMTEAWMLADWQTVIKEIGSDFTPQLLKAELKKMGLTLPNKPHQAASDRDPKHTLEQIVRITRGRRQVALNSLYEPLGRIIKLETLDRTADYQQFTTDLTAALVALGKIRLQP